MSAPEVPYNTPQFFAPYYLDFHYQVPDVPTLHSNG